MGGRGASYGIEVISAIGDNNVKGSSEPLIVAGMTPTDKGSRYTNIEKSLQFIENKKRKYSREQLQVLDEHGYVTRAFQGNEHSVAVDSNTREYMQGKVVTHNHPAVYGGTFSYADIQMLQAGMKELRASAREGDYSLKAMDEADAYGFAQAYAKAAVRLQREMYAIAEEMATKKKWSSKRTYEYANRKRQLEVIHKWYEENACKYGYNYTFTQIEKSQNDSKNLDTVSADTKRAE